MNNPVFETEHTDAASQQAGMRAIFEWLNTAPSSRADNELSALCAHLAALRETPATAHQRAAALDQIFTRSTPVIATLLPALKKGTLPVLRKTRHSAHRLQDLLQMLADDLLQTLDEHFIQGLHRPKELTLWHILHALAQHLLISNLVSAPPGVGIWQQLHQTYTTAQDLKISERTPDGKKTSLQQVYFSALLLGCSQPASFTAHEINFIAEYLNHFADSTEEITGNSGTFWVDPSRDVPAFACSRKTAAPDANLFHFSCNQLIALIDKQLADLDTGITAAQLNLPAFAESAAGRGVLRRLTNHWGNPGKRRFQRRRKNCRARLCAGLNRVWPLFNDGQAAPSEVSNWMITNESPDGYAIMHVSGKTSGLAVGDVAAIRSESGADWKICLVRWALSENPEHLELGLQILAPHAVPATLTLPENAGSSTHSGQLPVRLPALILPEIPPLCSTQRLLLPAGALHNRQKKLILIVEQENIELREVRATRLDEQTGSIEVFSIQSDRRPG